MDSTSTFADLVAHIINILQLTIPLIFAATLMVILWKIADAWIINGGEESKISEGKQVAFIGVIVLVVMVSIWGILALLRGSLF